MKHKLSSITLAVLCATSLNVAYAQEQEQKEPSVEDVEVIEVSGIRCEFNHSMQHTD